MNDNNNEIPIFIDGKKLLNFKIKNQNETLEELRESLGDIIPRDHVFQYEDGDVDAEEEEFKTISQALIGGAIHFKTQVSIYKDHNIGLPESLATNSLAVNFKSIDIQDTTTKSATTTTSNNSNNNNNNNNNNNSGSNSGSGSGTKSNVRNTSATTATTTTNDDDDNNDDNEKESTTKKRVSLMNINIDENKSKIIDYCNKLPFRYSINSETFQDNIEVVCWDISNAIIFPPQETLTFITKSTFNSAEHNAHKGGLYSWNGTLALKSIVNATTKGQIEKDSTKANDSKTVYSYTHGMVSRIEVRIEQEHITLKNSFINSLEDASSDLNSLKEFLKNNEFFPTRYVLGGKISSTGYKKDCNSSDKESFGLTLENRFKASFHDSIDLDLGANINKNNSKSTTLGSNYSFDEKRVSGGDVSLKDDFEEYILSLEKIENCSIIEIGNLVTIWSILKNQKRELYDKCMKLLNSEDKTFNVQVSSCVKTKSNKGYSKFVINDKEIDFGSNVGFNVVLLDSNGNSLDCKSFCTSSIFFFSNRSKNLAKFLDSVKVGTIILLSVNGDGFSCLKEVAQKSLIDFGIDNVEFKTEETSFCAIIRKGDKQPLAQKSGDNTPVSCEKTIIVKS